MVVDASAARGGGFCGSLAYGWGHPMKLLTEYLERAAHFQNLAEAETDLKLKEQLQDQAKAYLKLAAKRGERGWSAATQPAGEKPRPVKRLKRFLDSDWLVLCSSRQGRNDL
jgi:hypothetical protein